MDQDKPPYDKTGLATGASGKESLLALLILILLSLLLLRPSIRGHDGMGNYAYLMSVLIDGDLNFANEYAAFDLKEEGNSFLMSSAPRDPVSHRPANRYGIGAALFWTPAVAPVHGLLRRIAPEEATGLSLPYAWAVGAASAFWGCLGGWLLLMRLRQCWPRETAWIAAAAMFAATPLAFYVWAHGSMSHAVSFFVAVMAMLQWEAAVRRRGFGPGMLCGLWAGLLAITRFQDAVWGFAMGLGLLLLPGVHEDAEGMGACAPARIGWRARLLACSGFTAGVVLAFIPQMVVWHELYGSALAGPLPYLGREGGRASFVPVNLPGVLFGARHGLFSWHPVLMGAVAGWVMLARGNPRSTPLGALVWTGLFGFMLQVWLVSGWSMWWAGASFGNRFFISAYPWLAFGLAGMLEKTARKVSWPAVLVILLLLVAWNAGLLLQYGAGMIPREEAVDWLEVVGNMFTRVPGWFFERI